MEIKVGDKLRLKEWSQGYFVEVLFVGKERFFGLYSNTLEMDYMILNDWLPYEEPKKTVKVKVPRENLEKALGAACGNIYYIPQNRHEAFVHSDFDIGSFVNGLSNKPFIEVEGELVE